MAPPLQVRVNTCADATITHTLRSHISCFHTQWAASTYQRHRACVSDRRPYLSLNLELGVLEVLNRLRDDSPLTFSRERSAAIVPTMQSPPASLQHHLRPSPVNTPKSPLDQSESFCCEPAFSPRVKWMPSNSQSARDCAPGAAPPLAAVPAAAPPQHTPAGARRAQARGTRLSGARESHRQTHKQSSGAEFHNSPKTNTLAIGKVPALPASTAARAPPTAQSTFTTDDLSNPRRFELPPQHTTHTPDAHTIPDSVSVSSLEMNDVLNVS